MNLSPAQIKKLREKADASYYFFVTAILGYDKMVRHLHEQIAVFVCDHTRGKKKMVLIPRNHFKSRLITIGYPMWRIAKNRDVTCLICNENDGNVREWIVEMERHWESNLLLRAVYPEVFPPGFKPLTWSGLSYTVNRTDMKGTPTIEGVGVKSAVTSKHRDIIIEDDLISKDALDCPDTMVKAIEFHRLIESCFDDEAGEGEEIVVGTRWAKHDLYQHIIDNEPEFQVYCRAAMENGQPIFPERFSTDRLKKLRRRLGTFFFSCQYTNDPRDPDDVMLHDDWPKKFIVTDAGQFLLPDTGETLSPADLDIVSVADPAHSEKNLRLLKTSKHTVIVMAMDKKERVFLVDYFARRGSRDPFIEKIFHFNRVWRPRCCGIEEVGYQTQLKKDIELMSAQKKMDIYIKGLHPQGKSFGGRSSKIERIKRIIPFLERGDFYIRGEKDLPEFWEEYQAYPSEQVSLDILDCLAYGLTILIPPDKYGDEAQERADEEAIDSMNPVTGY